MLAAGVTPVQVSRAVGVTESYISQLQSTDEGFKEKLAAATSKTLERVVAIKEGYESLEQGILEQMKCMLATSDMRELTSALKVVASSNPARLNGNGASQQGDGGRSATVSVTLPQHVVQAIDVKVNARNEVVEVDGKSMIPLTPRQVQSKLSAMGRETEIEEVQDADTEQKEYRGVSKRFAEIEQITGNV